MAAPNGRSVDAEVAAAVKQQNAQQMQQNDAITKQREQQERQRMMEERKRLMLKQVLEPAAGERLSRVRIVKPETAALVEQHILQMLQTGKIRGKVDEESLKQMLSSLQEQKKGPKIQIRRKRGFESDSDDDEDGWSD